MDDLDQTDHATPSSKHPKPEPCPGCEQNVPLDPVSGLHIEMDAFWNQRSFPCTGVKAP